METKRQRQVGSMIKKTMAEIIFMESGYMFQGALVTVTDVKMTSDLGIAKIYLSVFNAEDKMKLVDLCNDQMTTFRHALAKKLRNKLRRIPLVNFYIDETLDEMYKLNKLFDGLDKPKEEE